MGESVNIFCLLWKGNFRGRDYREEDVWRLYRNVARYLDIRYFNFYTLTNDMSADLPGTNIELIHNWPGWWSKVELFRPDLPKGKILYIDLDSRIINNLQPVIDYGEGEDLVLFPTKTPEVKQSRKNWFKSDGIIWKYQASTMLLESGDLNWVYEKFKDKSDRWIREYRSEQDIYGDWLPYQLTFPEKWLMKLMAVKKGFVVPEDIIFITGGLNGANIRDLYFAPWLKELTE